MWLKLHMDDLFNCQILDWGKITSIMFGAKLFPIKLMDNIIIIILIYVWQIM